MKAYELLYFVDPALEDSERIAAANKVSEMITGINGTIDSVDEWGKRKLAYEIDNLTDGYYYLVNFSAEPDQISELNRVLRIDDDVVRYMVTRRIETEEA
ncbi:MAG: 30S ribosomal protein S6 [Coriobacteriales bacterium]|jgi:small subunit ribosomal protein S6